MKRVLGPLILGASSVLAPMDIGTAQTPKPPAKGGVELERLSTRALIYQFTQRNLSSAESKRWKSEIYARLQKTPNEERITYFESDSFWVRDTIYKLLIQSGQEAFEEGEGMTQKELDLFKPDRNEQSREAFERHKYLYALFTRAQRQVKAQKGSIYRPSKEIQETEEVSLLRFLHDLGPINTRYLPADFGATQIDPKKYEGKRIMEIIADLTKKKKGEFLTVRNCDQGIIKVGTDNNPCAVHTTSSGPLGVRLINDGLNRAFVDFFLEPTLNMIDWEVTRVRGKTKEGIVEITPKWKTGDPQGILHISLLWGHGLMDIEMDVQCRALPVHQLNMQTVEKPASFNSSQYSCTVGSVSFRHQELGRYIIPMAITMHEPCEQTFANRITGVFYDKDGNQLHDIPSTWHTKRNPRKQWAFDNGKPHHGTILLPIAEPLTIKQTIKIPNIHTGN
jgi:hypothetical protein